MFLRKASNFITQLSNWIIRIKPLVRGSGDVANNFDWNSVAGERQRKIWSPPIGKRFFKTNWGDLAQRV